MNNEKKMLVKIWELLGRSERWKTLYVLLASIFGAAIELAAVSIIMPIINLVMGEGNMADSKYSQIVIKVFRIENEKTVLIVLIMITILIYILKNAYLAWMTYLINKYALGVRRKISTHLLEAYLDRPYPFFVERKSAELTRSIHSDTIQMSSVIMSLCTIISQGVTAVCITVYLIMVNPVITFVVIICLGICAVGIIKILSKTTAKMGRKNQEYQSGILKCLQQSFEGIKEIKVTNTEKHFSKSFDEIFRNFAENDSNFRVVNMLPKYLIETVVIVGIMGYLAWSVCFEPNYAQLVPQLAAFVFAAYKLLPSVNTIYTHVNSIHYYKASVDLVYRDIQEISRFVDVEEEKEKEIQSMEQIVIQNVEFSYEGTQKKVLEDVSFSVAKGQAIALIGPSGGGKSTLADLILGLQKPNKGAIKVDGIDIQEAICRWHEKIGYIPQVIYLADTTIRENIAFGIAKNEIDDEKVWHALKEAQLYDFVRGLDKGLDTEVGERGVCLSGGQRQRIGIARALYREPDILVFDEATSALDVETEREVMGAINGLHGSKTMIIIAHRLSTIEQCDVVYRVEDKHVIREV